MNPFLSGDDLLEFGRKVEKLRAEGLSTKVIMERLGIPRTTYNSRMQRYRKLLEQPKSPA